MRAVIIHNPSSGMSADRSALNAAVEQLGAAGWETIARETQARGDATKLARAAADEGFDAAFAVGGDGTLNEVMNGLLASQTALGVLPLGTANVWAIEMGLPLNDLPRAAQLQAHAPARPIDIGMAMGKGFTRRAFMLFCGVGFDASVIHEVEQERALKRRWGKIYFVAMGVRQAIAYRGRRMRVTVDGKTYRRRLLFGVTSNTQLYAALFRIPPDARIDDGLLDVTLFEGDNALHTAWHFLRLGANMFLNLSDPEQVRGREVAFEGAELPIHLDAEPVGTTPVHIELVPRALRVLVPETANRGLFTTNGEG